MTTEQIKKEFPNLKFKDLQGGCNVYLPGGLTLTFWYKKHKWKSNKRKEWASFANTQDVFNLISGLGDVQIRKSVKRAEIAPVAVTNTTQICIDHVLNKIKIGEKVGAPAAVLNMMKTIAKEFEQFL